MINPAKYRYLVTIRQADTDATRNAYGERTTDGNILATVWAGRQDWSGRESLVDGQETPIVYTRWFIRWRNDVTPDMSVIYDGDEWKIESVMDRDGDRKELTLMCRIVGN